MALPDATKSARLMGEAGYIDSGSNPGRLELLAADLTVLARLTLQKPCGTTGGTDTLTLAGPLSGSALAVGTVASARITTSTGALVRPMTVGTSGADVNLTTLNIASLPATVAIDSATIKHPA